ncbi:B-cell lymphoma/leukemia 10 [Electrophorus electricus]|uniref:B-cell lymphoma/leukemia 10 n=1 Tax=Electrophorus electricus TaxID=8005 RepID=A0A4W4DMC6_ELEEL|nr:B-cell lymphoma/leukemia 10 [Electrophorus electricus]
MDVSHLTEDEMAEVKKEALERLRPYLVDKLIAERHFDYLRSKRILTREDTEEINCRSTRGKRAGKLLDLLAENPRGLDMLIESIQHCRTVNFIIVKITDEVQRVKNEKLEALKAASTSSSSYSTAKCMAGATNDLSKTDLYDYDKFSTVCLHPDGEGSPASSVASSSLNLQCVPSGVSAVAASLNVSSTSSCLPKPGDPGAPPLPDDLETGGQDMDAGACGSTGNSGDVNFQPLRSRSLSPFVSDAC